ncbi:MAG: outer membrane protein assembly factor BamD [Bdellovibrionales bacterium]|nr:outer membrane protein assembly factor BamD [Bdellovibrionales bacterium]
MKTVHWLIIFAFVSCCIGCSSKDAQGRTEINAKDEDEASVTEAQLLQQGKKYFEEGLYSVAQEKFQSLVNNFPLGPYAEFSSLKIADAEYAMAKYTDAISSYQSFSQSYPNSAARPYAILQVAICFQLANQGIGRDNATLEGAEKAYQKLFTEYPDSLFSDTGKKGYDDLLALRAAHQEFILNFYKKRGFTEAYEARKQEFDSKWKQHLKNSDEN